MRSDVSGAVLAGGKSRRMGCDKALLPINGMTMLEYQVCKLRELGIVDLMVSGSREPVGSSRFIADIVPDSGPLGGLHACLSQAERPNCLVLSVDVPLVPQQALMRLIEAHCAAGFDATLLRHSGVREPLIAVYRSTMARHARELLERGERSVRALLRDARCQAVDYEGPEALLTNCNSEEDYRQVCRLSDEIWRAGNREP